MKRISNHHYPCMHHHSLVKESEVCYSVEVKEIVTGMPGFERIIRSGGVIYVDKTEYIYRMIRSNNNFFFISRPRRFGKSLMCATLDALFSGKKELFKDLYISKTDYDFEKYPVLRFDFSIMKSDEYDTFLTMFQNVLQSLGKRNGCTVEKGMPSVMLQSILDAVENPVIIIDEFDSAIIDAVSTGKLELAEQMRSTFNAFYSVIKSYTPKIRFFFITGCTKLSGLNIFSAMNNLKDITRDSEFAAMFGYTEKELEHYFEEHIDYKLGLAKDDYSSRREFLDALRSYYDGYRFAPKNDVRVYNPVSVGYYFSSSDPDFENYWMQTGGASTLAVMLAKKADLISILNARPSISENQIVNFDITSLSEKDIDSETALALLVYSGYLTIAEAKRSQLFLDFPNNEVRVTFLDLLLKTYSRKSGTPITIADHIYFSAEEGDVDALVKGINEYYAYFNYTDFRRLKEQSVRILFKSLFIFLGFPVFTEIPSGDGISDAVLLTDKYNYLIEFKTDGRTSDMAMEQILKMHYADIFSFTEKPLHLIGIDFRTKHRKIVSYTHQVYGSDEVNTVRLS